MAGLPSTPVELPPAGLKIDFGDRILLLGSCFSSNIGSRLQAAAMPASVNPFGVLYNPASIGRNLDRLVQQRTITAAEIRQREDIFFHYDF
ncbi:MAG: GSCFA domain-containing protein, partial [Leptospiraceae bacterium]|nr:GSCFA domain-containing protein [Leptospiraceae bacterium]